MHGAPYAARSTTDIASLDRVRRRLRVRLLQDLVRSGSYRVPTADLATCLQGRVDLRPGGSGVPPA